MLRAWVAAGAKDDAAEVKVELPAIKAKKKDGCCPGDRVSQLGRTYDPALKNHLVRPPDRN